MNCRKFLYALFVVLVGGQLVYADLVYQHDITTPGNYDGNVIVYGNVNVPGTIKVRGDLIVKDGTIAVTGDLVVTGKITVSNEVGGASTITVTGDISANSIITNGVLDAYVKSFLGDIDVASCLQTRSTDSSAYVLARGDIVAGSILTNGQLDSYVSCTGDIDAAGDIATNSVASVAYVMASENISAHAIRTNGNLDCSVSATGGDIDVAGDIETRSTNGDAYVLALSGIDAGSIITNGSGLAGVTAGGVLSVAGDISTKNDAHNTSVAASLIEVKNVYTDGLTTAGTYNGDVIVTNGNVSIASGDLTVLGNLIVNGGYIELTSGSLTVKGDIVTNNGSGDAYVTSVFGSVTAKHISTDAPSGQALVNAYTNLTAESITTNGSGDSYVVANGDILNVSGDIKTKSTTGNAYVTSGGSCSVTAKHISTDAPSGGASVDAANNLTAESITTNGSGDSYVQAGIGILNISGDIKTKSSTGDAYVTSVGGSVTAKHISTDAPNGDASVHADLGNLTAESITTNGEGLSDTYAVYALAGDLEVAGDIKTKSLNSGAAVFAYGTIKAKQIFTDSPTNGFVQTGADGLLEVDTIVTKGATAYVYADPQNGSALKFDGPVNGVLAYYEATGDRMIDGFDKEVVLGAGSLITLDGGYTLTMQNMTLSGLGWWILTFNNALDLLTFKDATVELADNISITKGALRFDGESTLRGNNYGISFEYGETPRQPNVLIESGILTFDLNGGVIQHTSNEFDEALYVDSSVIKLDSGITWNATVTFVGACILDGNNQPLTFGTNGEIVVAAGGTLTIKNVTIKDLAGTKLRCADATGVINFENVTLVQSGHYTFATGAFTCNEDVKVRGSNTSFVYESTKTSTINANATLLFDRNVTFSYKTTSAKNLLEFADESATLALNNATIRAGTAGLQLTVGQLEVDRHSALYAEGDGANGITLGDGVGANDLHLTVKASAYLRLEDGTLVYNNVSGDSLIMDHVSSSITIGSGAILQLATDMNLDDGFVEFESGAVLARGSTLSLTGATRGNMTLVIL